MSNLYRKLVYWWRHLNRKEYILFQSTDFNLTLDIWVALDERFFTKVVGGGNNNTLSLFDATPGDYAAAKKQVESYLKGVGK
jgi:hypothetical protein